MAVLNNHKKEDFIKIFGPPSEFRFVIAASMLSPPLLFVKKEVFNFNAYVLVSKPNF